MKVYQLIEALKACDLSKEVYIYVNSNLHNLTIDELSDRVDLNLLEFHLINNYQ